MAKHVSLIAQTVTAVSLCISALPGFAAPRNAITNPDFTQGGKIPDGAVHDWNLGPTGARGWMFSDKLVTTDARQIVITRVDKKSPAEGLLNVGDVILGVDDKHFSYDPRTELGRAITKAESETGGGRLTLIRWRAGKTERVVVKLPVLGTYSATAPFDCPKSQQILTRGCQTLALRVADAKYRETPITRSLNALALLASGNPEYLPLVRKDAQWASNFSANGFQSWHYGYVIMLLSEYVLATGDESVLPGLRRLSLEVANGQSIVGSWGHTFAGSDGRLIGYGMMNSPGVPLTISLILAREAGVKDPKLDEAITKSTRLLRFYVGKGAIPYGDHRPWIQTHDDNGKCGMAAVMFNLLGDAEATEFFSRMSIASHGPERDTGHTGNFFNILWSLPGVAPSGPNATGAWMQEFGSWYFDLARRWDGTFSHQGPPATGNDKYAGWDCTGAYLLAYAIPLQKLYLTGKRKNSLPAIDTATAQSLIADGRGWDNKDRTSAYDQLTTAQLVARLSNWSPVVRERAAMALGRRQEDVVATLVRLLDSPELYTQYGACQALKMQRGRAAPAVAALLKTFSSDDLWLRILVAEALAGIGDPAKSAVPDLLTKLAKSDLQHDPRNMEQRYLCFALFEKRDGLIGKSLAGVDRKLLVEAVRAGLRNEDGRARGSLGTVYANLTYNEIKPLLPYIHQAIVEPSPSGIMFASGIRLAGLDLLSNHQIREGLPLCVDVMEIEKWGKRERISRCLKCLDRYGGAAKPLLPKLRQIEKDLLASREAKNLKPEIDRLHALIKKIESASDSGTLPSIADL